jgi:hypothetical protein
VKKPPHKSIIVGKAFGIGSGAASPDNNEGDENLIKDSPDVARLSDGGFVLVWQGRSEGGGGIYARRYGPTGTASGDAFSVARSAAKTLTQPVATGLGTGGFVVAWASTEKASVTIEGQRFDAKGNKAGAVFVIGTGAAGEASALARLGDGFVAVWPSARQGSRVNIAGQRYDATARKLGAQLEVNVTKSGDQKQPAVAALDEGFVVAWLTAGQTGANITARRYNPDGIPQGGEVRVNAMPVTVAANPKVASHGGDDFVVAWAQSDGDGLGIYAQRLGKDGKVGGGIKVNTTVAKDQSQPAIAAFDNGAFAIAWTSQDQDGSGKGVYSRLFDEEGQATGGEVLVNTATSGDQSQPRAVALSDSRLVAVWTSVEPAARTSSIAGQGFDLQAPGQTAGAE